MIAGRAGAIIVAAGAGVRFGADKVFATLGNRPVIAHSIEAFERCSSIATIALVLAPENVEGGRSLACASGWTKVSCCAGGARRQDSVRQGLVNLQGCALVAIHDGVRPFVTIEMIERGLAEAATVGAAVAAVRVKDTVKVVDANGRIQSTPDRNQLWLAQTPQVFRYDTIMSAHQAALEEASDDAVLIERLGLPVAVYPGSHENLKITTPEDLLLAECLLERRQRDSHPV